MREIEVKEWPAPWVPRPPKSCPPKRIAQLAEMIRTSKRPVLYLGGGVIAANASGLAQELAHRMDAPVACSLMGLVAFPANNPLYLGMLGMHGARHTNFVLDEADLLIAIGARFGDRATGKVAEFCKHASIAHIDIDASEIDKIKKTNLSVTADAGQALRQLLPMLEAAQPRPDWAQRVSEIKTQHPVHQPASRDPLHPLNLLKALSEMLPPETIITTDVGQHQMWTAMHYPFQNPRTLQTSGGLGTMGFGLPAAIGAALASPDRRVVCISGDGSILMNIQELATAELNLDVTVIVFNNEHLGLVRQQQELFYGGRYHASSFHACPNFAAIAEGFGVKGYDLEHSNNPLVTLHEALSGSGPRR